MKKKNKQQRHVVKTGPLYLKVVIPPLKNVNRRLPSLIRLAALFLVGGATSFLMPARAVFLLRKKMIRTPTPEYL